MTDFQDAIQDEIQDYCRPNSIRLAGGLLNIARNKSLPVQYRYHLAMWARRIYAELVDENDPRLLSAQSAVADTMPVSPLPEKEEAFTRLIESQNRVD